MILALEPLHREPPALEPGWTEPLGGHCRIYHGQPSSEDIDYQMALALAPLESATVSLPLLLSGGQKHFLAARAVSPAGVEEQNTHVVRCAEVDPIGELLPAPLGAVSDLTAWGEPGGGIVVGFSYRPPLGYAAAEEFQVLSDRGSGTLDLVNPIATVPARPTWVAAGAEWQDHQVVVAADVLPVLLAVRACANGRSGPIGSPITVTAGGPPSPVVLP